MDAFDADALIYAAVPDHPLGRRVLPLFSEAPRKEDEPPTAIGSLLLLPEILTKPLREGPQEELEALIALLAYLDLLPLDEVTAELAAVLGAAYRLRAADSVHLATAVGVGADRFLTNNRRDFPETIDEIEVAYLDELPDPGAANEQRPG